MSWNVIVSYAHQRNRNNVVLRHLNLVHARLHRDKSNDILLYPRVCYQIIYVTCLFVQFDGPARALSRTSKYQIPNTIERHILHIGDSVSDPRLRKLPWWWSFIVPSLQVFLYLRLRVVNKIQQIFLEVEGGACAFNPRMVSTIQDNEGHSEIPTPGTWRCMCLLDSVGTNSVRQRTLIPRTFFKKEKLDGQVSDATYHSLLQQHKPWTRPETKKHVQQEEHAPEEYRIWTKIPLPSITTKNAQRNQKRRKPKKEFRGGLE